jgi:hypothetical protein
MIKKSTKKSIEKALYDWKPHQIYQIGKNEFDLVLRYGKINKGFIVTKQGKIVAETNKGYATINKVKSPTWKLLGYKSSDEMFKSGIDQVAKQFTNDLFQKGR